jgi:energy-coupling factor transporter ATP-binding protein EcfA2
MDLVTYISDYAARVKRPADTKVDSLSGGERRRVALCRLLLQPADMLLLDKPTNHLDAESVAWLERFLKEFKGNVIAITHDRYFLDNVAGWILERDRGAGIPWQGTTRPGSSRKPCPWALYLQYRGSRYGFPASYSETWPRRKRARSAVPASSASRCASRAVEAAFS